MCLHVGGAVAFQAVVSDIFSAPAHSCVWEATNTTGGPKQQEPEPNNSNNRLLSRSKMNAIQQSMNKIMICVRICCLLSASLTVKFGEGARETERLHGWH